MYVRNGSCEYKDRYLITRIEAEFDFLEMMMYL